MNKVNSYPKVSGESVLKVTIENPKRNGYLVQNSSLNTALLTIGLRANVNQKWSDGTNYVSPTTNFAGDISLNESTPLQIISKLLNVNTKE